MTTTTTTTRMAYVLLCDGCPLQQRCDNAGGTCLRWNRMPSTTTDLF